MSLSTKSVRSVLHGASRFDRQEGLIVLAGIRRAAITVRWPKQEPLGAEVAQSEGEMWKWTQTYAWSWNHGLASWGGTLMDHPINARSLENPHCNPLCFRGEKVLYPAFRIRRDCNLHGQNYVALLLKHTRTQNVQLCWDIATNWHYHHLEPSAVDEGIRFLNCYYITYKKKPIYTQTSIHDRESSTVV
jgi:hypothetical protein